ncbi:VWA domain-containing protein [Capsulimonas corticalis]|uniref:VWA domain-containing protein n=1 Tax=Capsulimonas corticalis TaxID=2219043 RepID=A0A402CPG4_9BACT|nr:substrate-binding domain-containing protein [Capsulimonas corticalis]BDI33089.1 VWA domain-containing protein [Capsulimonas corticalis]
MKWIWALTAAIVIGALGGCDSQQSAPPDGPTDISADSGKPADLTILSGSENKPLEPIIQRYAHDHNLTVRMDYAGSVDIMQQLENNTVADNAVWPANSLWNTLGDTHKLVKHSESIMRTPVVFGVKKSVAAKLGWIGKPVTVEQILQAAESGRLRYMMTSATQSNSGASAYIGYLYAFSHNPEVLTMEQLQKPELQAKIKRILGTVNRSAGSSGWLKDLFLSKYDSYDGMVNYESVIIDADKELVAAGKEPLYVIYPVDGLAIADSPLGYVDKGDAAKEKQFLDLQQYLLSQPVQQQLLAQGRRVGLVGMSLTNADKTVFNPDWGIDPKRVLSPIRFPSADVLRAALNLYQSALRKPSVTVYCLDFSGSMQGKGEEQVKSAMRLLLDQQQAKQQLLQASPQDKTTVIAFSDHILGEWSAVGNDPAALSALDAKVNALNADGGTDIYHPAMRAFDIIKQQPNLEQSFPAVILMTDGQSNQNLFTDFTQHVDPMGLKADVPVFAILFGDADKSQLQQLTDHTSGKIFDGSQNLVGAFREVKGYN